MTMPLPLELLIVLEEWERTKRTGTVALNIKDGRVLAYEVTERHRIEVAR